MLTFHLRYLTARFKNICDGLKKKAFFMSNYTELEGAREDNILTALVWSPEACREIALRVSPNVFSTRGYRVIAEAAIAYVLKYKKPGGNHIRDELDSKMQGITTEAKFLIHTFDEMEKLKDEINHQYVLDHLQQFIEKHTILHGLAKAADAAASNDIDTARKFMREALKPSNGTTELTDIGELMQIDFPPLRYILDKRIPVGLILLSGAPKSGKSWFCLDIALAARDGRLVLGKEVRRTEVLYLALEDNPRRLQHRTKLIAGNFLEGGIYPAYAVDVPNLDNGLIGWLENQLDQHPEIGLIVIDPLPFVAGRPSPNTSPYQAEVNAMRQLKILAEVRKISILMATHSRKTKGEGRMDQVGGTHGLTGTVDTVIMLDRETGNDDKRDEDGDDAEMQDRRARLQIIGRDAETEIDAMVLFNGHTCTWEDAGPYHRQRVAAKKNTLRERILNALKSGDVVPRVKNIAEHVGATEGSVSVTLNRMLKSGIVENSNYGEWGIAKRTFQ